MAERLLCQLITCCAPESGKPGVISEREPDF